MSLDDPTGQMRWYMGLALIFFAAVPVVGMALVAGDDGETANAWLPVFVAAPINLAGVAFAVMSMVNRDPRRSSRRLAVAAGLVLLGGTALYGIHALIT